MITLPVALVVLGGFALVAFWLWLREQRPRELSLEVRGAKEAAAKAEQALSVAVSQMRSDLTQASDVLARRFTEAKDQLERTASQHKDEAFKVCAEVRGEMNALSAAHGLMRRQAQPFVTPGPIPDPREVVK